MHSMLAVGIAKLLILICANANKNILTSKMLMGVSGCGQCKTNGRFCEVQESGRRNISKPTIRTRLGFQVLGITVLAQSISVLIMNVLMDK